MNISYLIVIILAISFIIYGCHCEFEFKVNKKDSEGTSTQVLEGKL